MAPRSGVRFCLAVLGLILAPSSLSAAPWHPIGPWGAAVRTVIADPGPPGAVYAGSQSGGVYLSPDGGLTWTSRSHGLPADPSVGGYRTINGLTLSGNRLFACTDLGLYLSLDAGLNWQKFSGPAGVSQNDIRLFIDPADTDRLVLQDQQSGVYVDELVDTVRTWVKPAGMPGFPVHELERAPSDPQIYYAVTGGVPKVYRSTDDVHTWVLMGPLPGTKLRDLAVDATNTSRIYVSTDTGCWLSMDGGVSFARMDTGQDPHVYQFVTLGGSVVAFARGSVLTNQSDPDHLQGIGSFPYTRVGEVLAVNDTLFLASDMGVLAGTWNGTGFTGDFVLLAAGMNNACITAIAPVPNSDVIYVATGLAFDAGVYRSPDGGVTWEHRSNGLTNPDVRCLSVFPGNPDIAYLGTADATDDTGENGSVFKTTDGGRTWVDVGGTIPYVGAKQILVARVHPTNPDIVYVSVQGIGGGMYRSTDGGATWNRTSDGLVSMPVQPSWCASPPQTNCPQWSFWAADFNNYFAMLSMTIAPQNPNVLYLGSGGCWGGPYRSTDGGTTWVRRSEGYMEIDSEVQNQIDQVLHEGTAATWFPVHLELYDMDVTPWDPNHVFATGGRGQFDSADLFGIVYKSTDGGNNWSIVRQTARSDYFSAATSGMAMHAGRLHEIYISARDGVHVSLDEGATWSTMNDGLTAGALLVQQITFDDDDANRLYLGTINAGVWARDLIPVSVRLTHLSATVTGEGRVEVRWGAADPQDHAGFYVDREVNRSVERLTSSLITGQNEYAFTDPAPVAGALNRYWIVELSRTGLETKYGPAEVSVPAFGRLRLGAAAPNPVHSETHLSLAGLRPDRPVTVRVIDASGRQVATLLSGTPNGQTEVVWKAADDRGSRVPAGVYFIEAASGGTRVARRVLVLP
jgi:photosystem II stability/assembly factor-like uncharacterized protein